VRHGARAYTCVHVHRCRKSNCLSVNKLMYYVRVCAARRCGNSNTGWRRPIGCFKLQVIFRKRANNYQTLLRKMMYKDKASYASSPPCTSLRCSAYTHTHIHTHATCTHTRIHAYMHTHIHTYTHTHIHTYTHTHIHAYMHTCIHT